LVSAQRLVDRLDPTWTCHVAVPKSMTGASCAKVTTLVTTLSTGYEMAEIGIKELKATASSVIDEVEGGSAYVVTKRGRPAAVLMPVDEAEDLVLANAGEYVRQRRQARADYAKGRSVRLEDLD
jgi:prevent-host-death family protein